MYKGEYKKSLTLIWTVLLIVTQLGLAYIFSIHCTNRWIWIFQVKLKKVDHVLKALDTSPVKGSLEIIPFRVK